MKTNEVSTQFVAQVKDGYICQATVKSDDGISASMIGNGNTLQEASEIALSNTYKEFYKLTGQDYHAFSQASPDDNFDTSITSSFANDKVHLKGGGNKPISAKQQDLIARLAQEKGLIADHICNELHGKNIARLTGQEANVVINELKNRKTPSW